MVWEQKIEPDISRREFLTVVGGVGVAAGMATYAGPASAATLHKRAYAAAAAKQSVLKIVSGESDGPAGTIDPAFSTSDADGTRISLVYDRLLYLDNTWKPQPQLATSWSSNKEGTVWEFKLPTRCQVPRRYAAHIRGRRVLVPAPAGKEDWLGGA